jgi:hypothetical protein
MVVEEAAAVGAFVKRKCVFPRTAPLVVLASACDNQPTGAALVEVLGIVLWTAVIFTLFFDSHVFVVDI